ncbi:WhiB family transcriptional regulator [Rhodococcus sp. TAF43]|uniref:WhiB family transcriptional regulator n=1 Tax=unclassified Rhodococcus (in: high G+C Gram-positive bacteria) TaxID=192944 RepID=UPI000E0A7943|nr:MULTISPECIES: WhiB family transcriptional regulator [unclassified Rhodococcus (in: high G+C Gram-positive bacteria)]QKT13277.1 WhiB family transcriptional regulator [Rhodococcus sp. W8901]RDI18987.1 WhiB family redox-sensing transcriptional regulator [Rhodococcus sp. AG1013]
MTGIRPNLAPLADTWEWQQHGNCQGMNEAVFFPPTGERGNARMMRERRAKAICAACPVVAKCFEHSLAVPEPFGVWGGVGESERAMLLRERRAPQRGAA